MSQIKVLICSDCPAYSQRLATALAEGSTSFKVVDTVEMRSLPGAALKSQPDIMITKVDSAAVLPAIQSIKKECPFIIPIIVSHDPNIFDWLDLIKSGICGLLPLRLFPRQIVYAVELIANGGMLCLPRLNPHCLRDNMQKEGSSINTLTSREREVLALLGRNYSNQEIADTLCLSESTVKTHLHRVFKKLNVRNRVEAVAILIEHELNDGGVAIGWCNNKESSENNRGPKFNRLNTN